MTPLDRRAIRQHFSHAADTYEAAAVLQREVEDRLLERLELYETVAGERKRRAPAVVVDLGAGPGRASAAMKKRWRGARVIAVDLALPMLAKARGKSAFLRPIDAVCADAESLPFADASVDLVFSSLCLQWATDLGRVFDEVSRVLKPGGLLLVSTFGPDTLVELRAAWASVDRAPHVGGFVDIGSFGDGLLAAGFRDPVLDRDSFTLEYDDAKTLMRELKAIGATNADARRARGLTGKSRLARVVDAYEAHRRDGVLPATYEVLYAQAFGPPPGQPRRNAGGEIATFPIDRLRGSRRPKSE